MHIFRLSSAVIMSVLLLCGCQKAGLYKEKQVLMGTIVEVISPEKKAAGIAFQEIRRIELLLSKYEPQSEISILNSTGRVHASSETFSLIQKCAELWKLSEGAFDPTIGPLADLWGFTDGKFRVPATEEIQETLDYIGMNKIILDEENSTVEFKKEKMKIDLGAIAKGYAVDCAVRKLKESNVESCLINAGGDIYCLGDKAGKPWKIEINNPYARGPKRFLDLKNKAAATSGDYEQYFIAGTKRYAHIFNPKTGFPVESRIFSVTVVAGDCLTADALATSVFVLGNERSWEMTKKFGEEVRVMIFERAENQ